MVYLKLLFGQEIYWAIIFFLVNGQSAPLSSLISDMTTESTRPIGYYRYLCFYVLAFTFFLSHRRNG